MVVIGIAALSSMLFNLLEHHTYEIASRLALFSAALVGFLNPTPFEQLIKNRPFVALAIAAFFVVLIVGFYIFFYIMYP